MKLLINIPAYNEEAKIQKTIKAINRNIKGFKEVKIQVIDDGSTDKTAQIAKKAGADFVFSSGLNRGLGSAFRVAVHKALAGGFNVMVNLDADGQFDPAEIFLLTDPLLQKKADIAIGSRFSGIKPKNMPFLRKSLNWLAAKSVSFFLGEKIDDITCGFRAYNREALLRLNLAHQFTYTQETIIDALGKNLKVLWIPVHVRYFKDRKSHLTKSLGNFIYQSTMIIVRTFRDTNPLKFFGSPAIFLIFSSFLIFLVFSFFYFQDFKITPYKNWLSLASILLLLGIQFMVFAFLADMIRTSRKITEDEIYETRKKRFSIQKQKNKKS
jgi:glycosyltransferase involved in cell wall biosynthesis